MIMNNKRMGDFKEYRSDKTLMKYSAFIISTFTVLCVIYAIIKHLGIIVPAIGGAIGAVLGLFTSFFIGLVIAYLVNPLVNLISRRLKLEGKKRGRLIAVLISYIAIIAAIFVMIYMFISMIAGQLVTDNIPGLISGLQDQIQSYEQNIQSWLASHPNNILSGKMSELADTVMNWITHHFSSAGVISTVTGFGVSIANFVIGLIFSIYLLLDKEYFIGLWNRILGLIAPRGKDPVNSTLSEINGVLSQFLRGVFIDAVIVAVLSSIALTVYGLQFSVFIGIFAGVCNVIPYFGPVIGMVPAFIVGLLTDNWVAGIIAVVILFAVQQIDANLIYPRVVGSQTGLKPVFVLLAVTIGGGIGGIAGMVLAVPSAGVLKIFFQKWERRREAKLEAAGASQEADD